MVAFEHKTLSERSVSVCFFKVPHVIVALFGSMDYHEWWLVRVCGLQELMYEIQNWEGSIFLRAS